MSAMFAFAVGDVSMRSVTFEGVISDLLSQASNAVDRQVFEDALELNCLWVDKIAESRKCALLVGLRSVLEGKLRSDAYADNDVAVQEVGRVLSEILGRYPECFE